MRPRLISFVETPLLNFPPPRSCTMSDSKAEKRSSLTASIDGTKHVDVPAVDETVPTVGHTHLDGHHHDIPHEYKLYKRRWVGLVVIVRFYPPSRSLQTRN